MYTCACTLSNIKIKNLHNSQQGYRHQAENVCGAFHYVLHMLNVQNTTSPLKITQQGRSLFVQ